LRVAAELSQEELAGRARMSADAIGALERGRRKAPQRETVDLLLQALAPSDADRAALVGAASRARMRSVEPIAGIEPVPRHNLPNRLTALIGRESALAEIHAQLSDSRLVTLVGAGGIGKTRLAVEVAAQQLDRWPDGVWFVELARVNDAALVAGTIALAVGGVQQSNETALQTLTRHLRHKRTLLLLDNCEHLIAEVAKIAQALLAELPVLELLATSRELLRVDGELVYRLSPLSDSSALALFEQRARAVEPDFRMTPQEAPIALEICRRLDGLPLAIELAAARVRTLTPKQLIRKLDARFELLSGGNRAAAPRQQTMHALIDWSYDLLPPAEQRFFRSLAVFAGGFALDSALAVCGGGALNSITSLFDKSMLLAYVSDGERRYVLLESMRDYALEKLGEAGEGVEASRRHVEFIAQLVESLSQRSPNAARAVLAVEIENIRTAISWCITSGEAVDLGARILVDSSLFYTQRLYGEYLQRARNSS
jgi:predicted ATPase